MKVALLNRLPPESICKALPVLKPIESLVDIRLKVGKKSKIINKNIIFTIRAHLTG